MIVGLVVISELTQQELIAEIKAALEREGLLQELKRLRIVEIPLELTATLRVSDRSGCAKSGRTSES